MAKLTVPSLRDGNLSQDLESDISITSTASLSTPSFATQCCRVPSRSKEYSQTDLTKGHSITKYRNNFSYNTFLPTPCLSYEALLTVTTGLGDIRI